MSTSETSQVISFKKGSLCAVIGCMRSGKSKLLIETYEKFTAIGKVVFAFKPKTDTRGEANCIRSRHYESKSVNCISIDSDLGDLKEEIQHCKAIPDVIMIDEAQFLSSVDYIWELTSAGVMVIVFALNNDRNHEMWDATSRLLSIADCIILLRATCEICGCDQAFFTKLIASSEALTATEQVLIETPSTRYIPVCRHCWVI